MSIFTNPIDAAEEEAGDYIQAVLDLLADRQPIPVLAELCDRLNELTGDLDDQELRRPEATGKWGMIEVVQHLVDSELVWAYRLRMVLAHDRPPITGYDQDRWAERLRYREAQLTDAISLLRVLRAANLQLIESLTEEELDRVGVHSERGEESVRHMLHLYAGHDLVHRKQLARIRQGVRHPKLN